MSKITAVPQEKLQLILSALAARSALIEQQHTSALRLFSGFYEGIPELVLDIFAKTLVIYNYAAKPESAQGLIRPVQALILEKMPWLDTVLVKTRNSPNREERNGRLAYGEKPAEHICEHTVWYALDLCMNQDASFYLDTRNLRAWLHRNMRGRSVLNTFAYTGSLGAAALAGGARQVIQTDRSRKFLALAQKTYDLNRFSFRAEDFVSGDFHRQMGAFKRAGRLFDCVILDPPFFSDSTAGRIDLNRQTRQLVNKVRPLVAHQGWLVVVNNALFVGGEDFLTELRSLCNDGYLSIEAIIPVPADLTGYPETRVSSPLVNPAPFNHSTKIVILRVARKDQAPAT